MPGHFPTADPRSSASVRDLSARGQSPIFWNFQHPAHHHAIVQLKKAIAIENPGTYYGSPRAALFLKQCYANPGDAMRVLNDGFESVEKLGAVRSAGDWWAMVLIAEGLAVLGEIELLTKLYPRIREAARTEWVTAFAGFQQFKKAAAIAAAAVGEHDEAQAFFRAALEEADRLPIKLEQPEVRRWYAKMLVERNESGDRARAHELLGEARGAYRTIGMPRHLDMADELLKD